MKGSRFGAAGTADEWDPLAAIEGEQGSTAKDGFGAWKRDFDGAGGISGTIPGTNAAGLYSRMTRGQPSRKTKEQEEFEKRERDAAAAKKKAAQEQESARLKEHARLAGERVAMVRKDHSRCVDS